MFQTAIAQVVEYRTAIGCTELTAQAAWAHRRALGQFIKGVVIFGTLLQQSANDLQPLLLTARRKTFTALDLTHAEAMTEQL